MKKILLILIGLLIANVAYAARFDWSLGEPAIIDDDTSTSYYGWSLGQPVVMYEYQDVGTNMQINISDAWKDVELMKINIGDVWKDVEGVQINIGDSWETVY